MTPRKVAVLAMTDLDQPYHGTPPTAEPTCVYCSDENQAGPCFGPGRCFGDPLWGSLRKPGEPPAPTMSEWIAKIAAASTPKRELDAEGRFQPWIRREGAA